MSLLRALHPEYSEGVHLEISRLLVEHGITTCGEYRWQEVADELYRVAGTSDGVNVHYYLVDTRGGTVEEVPAAFIHEAAGRP